MSRELRPFPVRVARIEKAAPSIKTFWLEPLADGLLPPFSAGAHITVEIPGHGRARRNPYSLAGSPLDTSAYQISVLYHADGRGGSKALHDVVSVGDTLSITPPVNLFPLAAHARKHVLVAGGIGITPIKAMCEQLVRDQTTFELHYAVRSSSSGAYAEDLMMRCGGAATLYLGDEGERLVARDVLKGQLLGTHLYVCGPQRLIEDMLSTARMLGWPEAALHAERFTAPAIGDPFEVVLAKSNVTVTVAPDQSMLEAIEAAGVAAPYLCRGGACGQCESQVVACEGTLLHADHVLTDAERASGKVVLPCVSRFRGKRLVLSL